jgi:rubrerythrin
MMSVNAFDPLLRFAEIERLVSKIYYRFSHLFLTRPELRDFWWEMAREEEQHASILAACRDMIANYQEESLDPMVSSDKADELAGRLHAFLSRGTPSLGVEKAFKIALDIESSEIDVIYGKLLQLGGPQIGKTMENLGVPASVQRQKLKAALRRFCSDPELLQAAERL